MPMAPKTIRSLGATAPFLPRTPDERMVGAAIARLDRTKNSRRVIARFTIFFAPHSFDMYFSK
jgi:hypothetical protein